MAESSEAAPPSNAAEDRIRETAKWLTLSLAAIAGVMLAGTQFSGVGAIEPGTRRFWLAFLGAILAAAGAAVILRAAVRTATTPPPSLQSLPEGVAKDDTLLEGLGSGEKGLYGEYENALKARRDAIRANLENPNEETHLAAETANVYAAHVSHIVQNVLRKASYETVAEQWKRSSKEIALGAAAATLGLMLFIWAVNPSEAAKASAAETAVISSVEARTIELTPVGEQSLKGSLGAKCDVSQPLHVLHLDQTAAGPDILVQQPGCEAKRLVLISSWGHLEQPAPEVPSASAPAKPGGS